MTRDQLVAYARQVAQTNGVDPDIFVRQIQQESGFNPRASNPSGARGIAQLMTKYYPDVNTSDPFASLDAAAQTMGQNLRRYGGDYAKALAAYNAGAGAVDKAGGVPAYAETQSYVRSILGERTMAPNMAGDTTPSNVPGTLSPADLSAIVEAHGGYVGVKQTDRMIPSSDPDFANIRKLDTKSPWSTIEYILADGKVLKVHFDPEMDAKTGKADPANPDGAWNVEPGTTATLANGTKTPSAASSRTLTIPNADGGAPIHVTAAEYSAYYRNINAGLSAQESQDRITIAQQRADTAEQQATTQAAAQAETERHNKATEAIQTQTLTQGKYVDPTQTAYTQALTAQAEASTAESQVRTQQLQQSMRPVALKAFQDAEASLKALEGQVAQGTISMDEAGKLAQQIHQGIAATIAGTTLFEQQKQAENKQTERAGQMTSLINQRVQSSSSLASALLSAIAGHVQLPAGQSTLGLDPFAAANQEVNQMGGGQETGDMAKNFLSSVFGGTASSAGGASSSPAGSFPTTREAVLAQYPHLAQPDQFVPPNLEANAATAGR